MINWLETLLSAVSTVLTTNLIPAVLILVIGIVIIRLVNRVVKATLSKAKLEKAAHTLILSVVNLAQHIILGLIVATKLGIDVTSIVALVSVLTLAVSLALQDILANVIGGFTILSTNSFHSGDYVDVAGQSGTVTEINMTYTRLTTPDGRLISIPNSTVVASQIVNYSAEPIRRMEFLVSVGHEVPVQQVLDALVLAGTADKALMSPSPFSAVSSYIDGGICYTLRVWVNNEDYWDVYYEVNQKIKKVFDEQGIAMTAPHVNVHLDK